jgi:hypothetical protein
LRGGGQRADDAGHERVQLRDRAFVHVGEARSSDLLLVGEQTLSTSVGSDVGSSRPHVLGRRDDHDRVEARLAAGLVEQRDLDDGQRGPIRPALQLGEPVRVGSLDARVQKLL